MIGKGKAISHGGGALEYAMSKKDARLIDQRFCYGENSREITHEFSLYQSHFPNVKNNTFRFELSPDRSNSKELSPGDWKKLSDDFLTGMGLNKNQSVTILHRDTDNPHLHILVNRVDTECRLLSDSFIGKSASATADRIALTRHLVRAKEVETTRKEANRAVRQEIFKKFQTVRKKGFRDFSEFSVKMKKAGITVNPTINSSGEIQGYRLDYKGYDFKASEVHRDMSYPKVKNGIEQQPVQQRNKNLERNNDFGLRL